MTSEFFFPASLTRLMWPSSSTDLYRTRWLGCAPDGVQFKCSQITVVFEPVQLQRPGASVDTEPWRTLGKEKELTKIKHQKFCAVSVYTTRYTWFTLYLHFRYSYHVSDHFGSNGSSLGQRLIYIFLQAPFRSFSSRACTERQVQSVLAAGAMVNWTPCHPFWFA